MNFSDFFEALGVPAFGTKVCDVYLSEGITDFVAGIITAIVIFSSYPRVFRRREEELANAENREKK